MDNNLFTTEDMLNLQNQLKEHKKTITTAESCTGGLIASMITEIAGSSEIFNGAVVTYSNEIKEKELNVKNTTLDSFGAVSTEVVHEMLDGVLKKFNADFAIAVSGIAGPGGATKTKPVGTVVIGVANNLEKNIDVYTFKGSRKEVQIQAAKYSLKKILNFFQKTLDK